MNKIPPIPRTINYLMEENEKLKEENERLKDQLNESLVMSLEIINKCFDSQISVLKDRISDLEQFGDLY
jgi:regulator of replication initiation timing